MAVWGVGRGVGDTVKRAKREGKAQTNPRSTGWCYGGGWRGFVWAAELGKGQTRANEERTQSNPRSTERGGLLSGERWIKGCEVRRDAGVEKGLQGWKNEGNEKVVRSYGLRGARFGGMRG